LKLILKSLHSLSDLVSVLATIGLLLSHGHWITELTPLVNAHWTLWFTRVAAACGLLVLAAWTFPTLLTPATSRSYWPVFLALGFAGQVLVAASMALLVRHEALALWQALVPPLCLGLSAVVAFAMTVFGISSILHLTLDGLVSAAVSPVTAVRRLSVLLEGDKPAQPRPET
jgi:hypothetical protein